ncbi:MAG: YgiT-type zinc finger protein [Methanosarcinales archaeon]
MKCVFCGKGELKEQIVEKKISVENDVVIVSIKADVCDYCGEQYFDAKTVERLEELEEQMKQKKIEIPVIGKVRKVQAPFI